MVDSPDFEGRDVQALIDFVARQPEARLDGPGDPRIGMSGPSYGGGIQIVTAAIDGRVDAITPTIAWNAECG
jgi:ABC-2 type transport system ATP-binding protein